MVDLTTKTFFSQFWQFCTIFFSNLFKFKNCLYRSIELVKLIKTAKKKFAGKKHAGTSFKKKLLKKCRLTPKRACTRFWLKMSKNAKKKYFLEYFLNIFFLQFWLVWRVLSICKDSFWIWIGLRKKMVQKCQNWEKMFLWSNRPLTWSGVVMVHFYVKTLS